MPKAALHNLGCKVNAYETEAMEQLLRSAGYEIVPFDSMADVYVINTCSVTNIADRKSRQMLHRAKKLNPQAVVVAAGCYVQVAAEQLKADPAVDILIGNNQKGQLAEILEEFGREGHGDPHVLDIGHTSHYEELKVERPGERTRAFIKVQDGCNQFCSYCIIPYARGRVRSREIGDVLGEVQALARSGYQEVVLTGIHLSSYGLDFEKDAQLQEDYQLAAAGKNVRWLLKLIEQVSTVENIHRIRLGSLEPRIVTEEFAYALAANPKICPHFHLSLQSGSDSVLKRMNRHYTADEYRECCKNLRTAFKNPAITTDVIVGFPGETEEEFAATEKFAEDIHFYEMHVFKYSRRAGTRAAVMAGQIPESLKGERSDILLALEERMSLEYRKSLLGTIQEVLLEEHEILGEKTFMTGYTRQYVRVAIPREEGMKPGQILPVKMVEFLNNETIVGEIVR
ncbi:MAG TPA: tRNA (N(6)-L-threonylcarbamoyladenosine(37)-C(2))-methylthiotransferase MtaB [Candidatus Enterocloster excrementigallinarum]|uniref:Threonylcarbamoyladenosine tRNA methylthiotransferase MtaB n=1 Tax=Candidatus Enterocloster excrementigallinarum TaxID=2838558 RepID=A0A9D2PSS1_9FIRM|nr:tRNA (N(6)-L-threonylcarbamoyladenosine(37)-C(2))-methylthiotransferase MtaB [Candidatus Enterocloster excrementigallinarum]